METIKFEHLSNEQLAVLYEQTTMQVEEFRQYQLLLSAEFEMRMGDMDALPTEGFDIVRKETGWVYNTDSLTATIKELITKEEWDSIFTKKWVEKTNGLKLNSLMKRYKGEVSRAIEESRTPTRRAMTIKRVNR